MNRQDQRLSGSSLGIQAGGDINIDIRTGMSPNEISELVHNAIVVYKEMNNEVIIHQNTIEQLRAAYQQKVDDLKTQLWDLHAAWAKGHLSQEAVMEYILISSAIKEETRIVHAYHTNRIFCIDPGILYYFVNPSNDGRINSCLSNYFIRYYMGHHEVTIATAAIDVFDQTLQFLSGSIHKGGVLSAGNFHHRISRLLGSLVELSDLPCATGVVVDPNFAKLLYDILRESRRGLHIHQTRVEAYQIAEVFAINSKQPADGRYVSLVTCVRSLLDLDDVIERSGLSVGKLPIQHVYGPAWSSFLEANPSHAPPLEIESSAAVGPLAKKLLGNLQKKREVEAKELTSEFVTLQNAIKRFGELVAPFHSEVINHAERQARVQQEYVKTMLEDMMQGGNILENVIKETISFINKWHAEKTTERACS
jgi:hypothetical protein